MTSGTTSTARCCALGINALAIFLCTGCKSENAGSAPNALVAVPHGSSILVKDAQVVLQPVDTSAKPVVPIEGPPWVLLGEDWVYVSGSGPVVSTDTVVASAEGSILIVQNKGDIVRAILIETKGKPGTVKHTYMDSGSPLSINRDFTDPNDPTKNVKHSYIEVDKKKHTISAPAKLDIKDATIMTPPTGTDHDAYDLLQKVDKALAGYNKKLDRDP